MRVCAVVAYDGTDYHGFQRQSPDREPSIQGSLERTLATIGQDRVGVLGSGRTDAGVHASGQVIAFDVEWVHGESVLQRALNAKLPASIAILHLESAAPDFHPRYDALSREYLYTIYNSPVRHPLYGRFSWHVPDALDVDSMHQAGQALVGEHDFAAFGQPTGHQPGESTVRTVQRVECWRDSDGKRVYVQVTASGFLYRMMRNIVGTLVAAPALVVDILASRDRDRVKLTAPPHGLCLTHVKYA